MSNINLNTGEIRLTINGDENRVIVFNPNDVGFVNRYYGMLADFEVRQKEFIEKAAEIDKITTYNSFGIKVSDIEGSKLMLEMCEYMKEQIDYVFGKGTSEKTFGDTIHPDMIDQFLSGVSEYILSLRNSKVQQYISRDERGVMK